MSNIEFITSIILSISRYSNNVDFVILYSFIVIDIIVVIAVFINQSSIFQNCQFSTEDFKTQESTGHKSFLFPLVELSKIKARCVVLRKFVNLYLV